MEYKCKKCGSRKFFTKQSGNNLGLYCSDCGKWVKWLNKNEARVFEHKEEVTTVGKLSDINIKSLDSFTIAYYHMEEQLKSFINFLDKEIDRQFERTPLSDKDSITKSVYAHAYEKNKNALINILNGKKWNEVD